MSELHFLLVDGGEVRMDPGLGWSWQGWDGTLTVSVTDRDLRAQGRPVALAEDLMRLALKLVGKAYTATGFSDIPGVVVTAQVTVEENTLCPLVTFQSAKSAREGTQGKFILTCVPSFKAASPPVPDPVTVKRGSWIVTQAAQSGARCRG